MKQTFFNRFLLIVFCVFLVRMGAESVYAQQTVYDPKKEQSRSFFNRGMAYLNERSYEAAIEQFLRSLREDSTVIRVHYYLGMAFIRWGTLEMQSNSGTTS